VVLFLVCTFQSICQKRIISYFDNEGHQVSNAEASNFTVRYKINDTCWALDSYRQKGPLRKREQYRDKECQIRNGECAYYNVMGIIDSSGHFINGLQNGAWIVYENIGSVALEEYYDSGILRSVTDMDSLKSASANADFIESEFPGGPREWQQFIIGHLRLPDDIINDNGSLSAQIMVGFTVEKDGSLHDIQIIRSRLYLIDDLAIDVIKKSPKFIAATKNGVKVKSYKLQPVNFEIP